MERKKNGNTTTKRGRRNPDLSDIDVGDWVKAAFGSEDIQEHMWVRVTKVGSNTVEGELDNEPAVVDMKRGEHVRVEPQQIEDVMRENPASGRLPDSFRTDSKGR